MASLNRTDTPKNKEYDLSDVGNEGSEIIVNLNDEPSGSEEKSTDFIKQLEQHQMPHRRVKSFQGSEGSHLVTTEERASKGSISYTSSAISPIISVNNHASSMESRKRSIVKDDKKWVSSGMHETRESSSVVGYTPEIDTPVNFSEKKRTSKMKSHL